MVRRFDCRPALVACLAALLLVLTLTLAACGPPRFNALGPGSRVLALGDSLTFGTGATADTSYPTILAAMTQWNVVNAGVPGDLAHQGCSRLAPLVAEHQPQLILVFLGGNDILRRASPQAMADGLTLCVDVARSSGIPMVLFAVPRFGLTGLGDSPAFATLAESAKVGFLSPQLGRLLENDAMKSDAVHLNAAGYRALAANVAGELRRLGYLRL